MPDETSALARRVDANERNHTDLAKSLTALVEDQRDIKDELGELKTDKAVRAVEARHLDERLKSIERSIGRVYNLGWWVLAAFGATMIASISSFILKGGLHGP